MKKLFQLGPILRMSVGIVSLMLALILICDILFGILPNQRQHQLEAHKQISNLIGAQIGMELTEDDPRQLQTLVERIAASLPEIRSLGVRQADGKLIAGSRQHDKNWTPGAAHQGSRTQVVVPLHARKRKWGEVEILFAEATGAAMAWEWIKQPDVSLMLLLSSFGMLGVYFYLRRALHHLDPSNVVPQRVRKAFDTLTEAEKNEGKLIRGKPSSPIHPARSSTGTCARLAPFIYLCSRASGTKGALL